MFQNEPHKLAMRKTRLTRRSFSFPSSVLLRPASWSECDVTVVTQRIGFSMGAHAPAILLDVSIVLLQRICSIAGCVPGDGGAPWRGICTIASILVLVLPLSFIFKEVSPSVGEWLRHELSRQDAIQYVLLGAPLNERQLAAGHRVDGTKATCFATC
jgi:hypothetical protein